MLETCALSLKRGETTNRDSRDNSITARRERNRSAPTGVRSVGSHVRHSLLVSAIIGA